ncbi:hypothetical protein ABIE44_002353 [Marmoricola sp. OAE513]|uniref:DUF5709 domain-containing protein n=1 Tax=Marmoricola sp. OAE513 TaxID=2817894 RepID=UPI001AE41B4E
MTEDQLQPSDTLDDRGVDDVLDEGYSPPERPMASGPKGRTPREQAEGETIEDRLAQEEPDVDPLGGDGAALDDEFGDPAESFAGDVRSGRLVAPDEGLGEDTSKDEIASDVGIDGAGASAEEAAMHVIDEEGSG